MKAILAVALFAAAALAQEADAPIRVDHYTESDLKRLADAQAVIDLAIEAKFAVMHQVNLEHGIIDRDDKNPCTPFDSIETRGKNTLVITHVVPVPDKDGKCGGASDEGYHHWTINGDY